MLSTISNINLMRKPVAAAPPPTDTPATYWLAFGPGTNSIKKIPVQYSSKQISFYEQQKLKLNVYVFIHFKQTTNQNKIHIKKIKTKIK